jgi:hypothetical protein
MPPAVASAEPASPAVASAEPSTTPERCDDKAEVFLFVSPATPVVGAPLRVLAVSDAKPSGELRIEGPSGAIEARSSARRGGPPYFWTADVASASLGAWTATLTRPACEGPRAKTTRRIDVRRASARLGAAKQGVWPTRSGFTHSLENLYSAWIEALFDAPENEQPSWAALHEVLRDPKRNLLYDHLGAGEDSGRAAPTLRPDCADLPYFLRAYFAWKLRLPFGLAECSRGGRGAPPFCKGLLTNEDHPDDDVAASAETGPVAAFGAFVATTVANRVHSGSARTPFEDEASDYYPVPLSRDTLRPGTVYADPYGHVLVIAKTISETSERGGVMYAVDGQPDGTIARKRFWRGNFLYANQRELGGPGFKHFRPLERRGGALVRLDDDAIRRSPEYGDLSRDPGRLDVEAFYDAMDDVLSPRPRSPSLALMETIDALEEQVRTRVQSVDNGRKWLGGGRAPASMPDGPAIFETTGAWEDFATPSRDLRLLIAIDVVRGFPARVARRSSRYALPPGASLEAVQAELERTLARELVQRTVSYTRTDGSPFTLRLADVMSRSTAFETTYNLNDCVELRWGAPEGSAEASTCRSRAPIEQTQRMETYRPWFHDRRRPPRR